VSHRQRSHAFGTTQIVGGRGAGGIRCSTYIRIEAALCPRLAATFVCRGPLSPAWPRLEAVSITALANLLYGTLRSDVRLYVCCGCQVGAAPSGRTWSRMRSFSRPKWRAIS
jgi:hypothetical protein